ncbi:hypothetical protein [Paraburkholderia terrae]|uniref:Uncharacterized protein n=1 Tax=Paraburkholderia terrae TaxID=311230 RepID=A0ABM7TG27_9BURK|nr:hypothetical protein [Paraburkholderia terrae]BCZ77139.1 hypothetical protein PTKU64_08140 [Paraburkholderia terrae]BDC37518.1 hypothetical protein PTKU15_08150 [Paraburkholderia terrae]
MRLVFRIDSNHISLLPAGVAVCVALALSSMSAGAAGVYAQESFTDATNVTTATSAQQTTEVAANETSNATADTTTGVDIAGGVDSTGAQFTNVPADSAAMSDFALDDQVLARQRGGAAGMVMVAATPQLMRGSAVTLWDEIAPPSPLPIPIDAARTAQGNVANYQRK